MSDQKRIEELVEIIEKNTAERDFFGATYKEVPYLKEIKKIIEKETNEDKDSLLFKYQTYLYLGEQYYSLGRFTISADSNKKALLTAVILFNKYQYKSDIIGDLFFRLLRDRNHYVDDDCKDILKILKEAPLIEEECINEIYQKRMNRRRNLKSDPVEMSEEYLNVIDEVEEKIEKNRKHYGMVSCYEVWDLKHRFLLEKGINWKSPAVLNPRVIFD